MDDPIPAARSRRARWWLGGAAAVLAVAAAVGAVRWSATGRYDPVRRPCDLVDVSPLRTADPFATDRSRSVPTHDDGTGGETGLRVDYCTGGYDLHAAAVGPTSLVRVAFAVYPSRRQAARAYLHSRAGDLRGDTGDVSLPTPQSVGREPVRFTDATGLGVPTAFCTAKATGADAFALGGGYLIAVREENLLLEVYVELTGERMTQDRHRWAAAAITRATVARLRSHTGNGS